MTTTSARLRPIARSAFVPPVRPLPSVRGSGALVSRETTMPNGIEPTTYDSAASTMATTICSAVTPGRTSWTPDDAGGLWPESTPRFAVAD